MSLVREFALAFCSWTVLIMTTAKGKVTAAVQARRGPHTGLDNRPISGRHPSQRLMSMGGLAAVVLGSQALAASSPQASAVRLLLPSEGVLAGLGDGLRRGYGLAMEQSRACGIRPPSLQLGWLPPGRDPQTSLGSGPRPQLVIAPPAAPLRAYGRLADQQRLNVLLPLQRGLSLEGLPQQQGADRLWPVGPARNQISDRLAKGLVDQRMGKVLVVRDASAEAKAMADRFIASLGTGQGQLVGFGDGASPVDGNDKAAMEQLVRDVDWYAPKSLAVFTQPGSRLARAIQATPWPPDLVLAWPFPVANTLAQRQMGVDPLSRGEGWAAFARAFTERWGYAPGLVETAGYDTGMLTALASVSNQGRPGWNLTWFRNTAKSQPLCQALQLRSQGASVRPQGAGSRLDLGPAMPPTAALRLSQAGPQP